MGEEWGWEKPITEGELDRWHAGDMDRSFSGSWATRAEAIESLSSKYLDGRKHLPVHKDRVGFYYYEAKDPEGRKHYLEVFTGRVGVELGRLRVVHSSGTVV